MGFLVARAIGRRDLFAAVLRKGQFGSCIPGGSAGDRGSPEFQVKLGWTDRDNSQMPVHGDDLAILQKVDGSGDSVDTRNLHLASDDGPVDEHPPAPFDNPGCQRDHVRHHRLDSVADKHLAGSKRLDVISCHDAADFAGDQPRCGWLTNELPRFFLGWAAGIRFRFLQSRQFKYRAAVVPEGGNNSRNRLFTDAW